MREVAKSLVWGNGLTYLKKYPKACGVPFILLLDILREVTAVNSGVLGIVFREGLTVPPRWWC